MMILNMPIMVQKVKIIITRTICDHSTDLLFEWSGFHISRLKRSLLFQMKVLNKKDLI